MSQFDRSLTVKAGDVVLKYDDVDIKGTITFSDEWGDDVSNLRIYNLSRPTINLIADSDSLEITAGYDDNESILYQGLVREENTDGVGSDRVTYIRLGSGIRKFQQLYFSKTYSSSVTAVRIVEDIVGKIPEIEIGNVIIPGQPYPARCISRTAFQEIEGLSRDFRIVCYLNNLEFFAEPEGLILPEREVELVSGGGLKQAVRGYNRVRNTDTVEIISQLDSNIYAGAVVRLDHPELSGVYRVVSGHHNIGEFESYAELVE